MSHFKAKIHQIRFLASVRVYLCVFVRLFVFLVCLCLRWSLVVVIGVLDMHSAWRLKGAQLAKFG